MVIYTYIVIILYSIWYYDVSNGYIYIIKNKVYNLYIYVYVPKNPYTNCKTTVYLSNSDIYTYICVPSIPINIIEVCIYIIPHPFLSSNNILLFFFSFSLYIYFTSR